MRAGDDDRQPGGPVSIGLLGPLRVTVAGRPAAPTAPRVRVLLAVLALAAGDSVPIERLAEAMWDGRQPADVRKAVQLYVVRLRAVVGAELIETTPAGYALRLVPGQVDVARFTRLLDQAQGSDSERESLRAALELWRGTPFEDVPSRWLESSYTPPLVERYLAAIERLADLDLDRADGSGDDLVARLTGLTARYPLRESLWLRLLAALDATGRRADALACYELVRNRLADELGTDPGPELRDAYADLLAGRPPRRPGRRTAYPVPRQLPPDVAGFTGRDQDLRRLDEQLGSDQPTRTVVCAIAGTGGVGKSALAIRAAHRQAARYPDGQLYADLQGATAGLSPIAPLEVLGRFLRQLGTDPEAVPTDLAAASTAFRTRVAGLRLLVVLDNAADAAQVRPVLPGGPACAVLVTSRTVLAGLGDARPLRLDVLGMPEAVALLGRLAGAERIAADPEAAADVVRSCAALPLAVRIAGARLAARPAWPVRALADRLADTRRRLDELEFSEAGARTSFAVSLEQARGGAGPDRAAADAFELLGVLDGPTLGIAVAARLLDLPEQEAERRLERLVDLHLLESPAPGRYRLHDLLRLYARELAEQHPEPVRATALHRVLTFYAATAWQTLKVLRPGDYRLDRAGSDRHSGGLSFEDDRAALRWLDGELPGLMAAVRRVAEPGTAPATIDAAIQVAHALYGFFMVRGYWSDWAELGRLTLDLTGAVGDRAGAAQAHNDLGVRLWRLGRYDEALAGLRDSLAIRRELGDRPGQAAALVNIGLVHQALGDHDEALARARDSLAISRAIDDPRGVAGGLNNLGDVYQLMGRYEQARACLIESLAINRELGDRKSQAIVLTNLGALHRRLHHDDEALAALQSGLEIFRELGDQRGQAEVLRELGLALWDRERFEEARAQWRRALRLGVQLTEADTDSLRALLSQPV